MLLCSVLCYIHCTNCYTLCSIAVHCSVSTIKDEPQYSEENDEGDDASAVSEHHSSTASSESESPDDESDTGSEQDEDSK